LVLGLAAAAAAQLWAPRDATSWLSSTSSLPVPPHTPPHFSPPHRSAKESFLPEASGEARCLASDWRHSAWTPTVAEQEFALWRKASAKLVRSYLTIKAAQIAGAHGNTPTSAWNFWGAAALQATAFEGAIVEAIAAAGGDMPDSPSARVMRRGAVAKSWKALLTKALIFTSPSPALPLPNRPLPFLSPLPLRSMKLRIPPKASGEL
jgi:hypothetical protein